MTNTKAAGYIVHDNDGTIFGTGKTADAAWDDMLKTMAQADIELISDEADSSKYVGSWTLESGLKTVPATEALLRYVEEHGGNNEWDTVNGVACTVED